MSEESSQSALQTFVTQTTESDGKKSLVLSTKKLASESRKVDLNGLEQNESLLPTVMALFNLHQVQSCPPLWGAVFAAASEVVGKGNADARELSEKAITIAESKEWREKAAKDRALIENFRFYDLFKNNVMSPVSAAMRGEETMALRAIAKNPSALLRKEEVVKNSVDVEYEITPLQAAIIANDIQLIERMKEHFASLTTDLEGNPIDGLAEMQRQMMQVYAESLTRYCQMQQERIDALQALQAAGNNVDPKTVTATQENLKAYSDALASNDLNTLVEAHHRAQEHNVFDFQPYLMLFVILISMIHYKSSSWMMSSH